VTINDYLKKKKLTVLEFAKVTDVSIGIARMWVHRSSSPRLYHAMKINKLTNGKVKLSEMLSYQDQKKLEQVGLQ
jgi:hypothetical protein